MGDLLGCACFLCFAKFLSNPHDFVNGSCLCSRARKSGVRVHAPLAFFCGQQFTVNTRSQREMEEMELDGLIPYVGTGNSSSDIEAYEHDVDRILFKVNEMEKRVNEVEQFYHDQSKKQPSISKGSTLGKDERQINGLKKLQQDGCSREAAAAKRMQQLISQFGVILRQRCVLLTGNQSRRHPYKIFSLLRCNSSCYSLYLWQN